MKRRNKNQSQAAPECLSIRLEELEVRDLDDGQFEFEAIAQFWDHVNDHGILFRKGAFAKTIQERVPKGAVKINDSHRRTVATTLGTVIEAEERDAGLWYKGRLASTSTDAATKLRERHVEENSLEIFVLREQIVTVERADLPVGGYHLGERPDGSIEVREAQECYWLGIGLCPVSSQRRPALLSTTAVPYADLPMADPGMAWDPDGAEERLEAWARRGGKVNWSAVARAHLLRRPPQGGEVECIGQIADVVDGELVVVPAAVEMFMDHLGELEEVDAVELAHATQVAGRYLEKSRQKPLHGSRDRVNLSSTVAGSTAGPPSERSTDSPSAGSPTTAPTEKNAKEEMAAQLRSLELSLLEAEMKCAHFPEVHRVSKDAGSKPAQRRNSKA